MCRMKFEQLTCISLAICILVPSFGIVKSQVLVSCYNDAHAAEGSPVVSTIDDCCNHGIDPPGLGYTVPGNENYTACPREFGFFSTTFSGIEHEEAYSVQVGTISGPRLGFHTVTISLEGLTAGDGDLVLYTTTLFLFRHRDPSPVSFLYRRDSIAQEAEETFILTIATTANLTEYTTRLVLHGTILDDDIAVLRLSSNDYSEKENALMPVKITKEQNVLLANPVTFKISPLTVAAALSRSLSISDEAQMIYPDSPVQANEEDFNTTIFEIIFPADEGGGLLASIDVFIYVVDDEINERDEQLFYVLVEVVNATNLTVLDFSEPHLAIARIIDNDPITIGFERQFYTYSESVFGQRLISEVALVMEDNRVSEQTFFILFILNDPTESGVGPAEIGLDYQPGAGRVRNFRMLFPAFNKKIVFYFFLFADDIAEGIEGFLVYSTPSDRSVVYTTPNRLSTVYQSTTIFIEDDDSALVGFERLLYSVNEFAGLQEVCVTVTDPAIDQPLSLFIVVAYNTVMGSADGNDFRAVQNGFGYAPGPGNITETRRMCVEIGINNDGLLEDVESFAVSLMAVESGVITSPNITVIRILDDDVATVGFINTSYNVNEYDGTATVMIGVLSGLIERDIFLSISQLDGSANVAQWRTTQNSTKFNYELYCWGMLGDTTHITT